MVLAVKMRAQPSKGFGISSMNSKTNNSTKKPKVEGKSVKEKYTLHEKLGEKCRNGHLLIWTKNVSDLEKELNSEDFDNLFPDGYDDNQIVFYCNYKDCKNNYYIPGDNILITAKDLSKLFGSRPDRYS